MVDFIKPALKILETLHVLYVVYSIRTFVYVPTYGRLPMQI